MVQDNSIQYVAPKTKLHKFCAVILERKLQTQVIQMDDSVLIYVNDIQRPCFNYLSMSMMTRFSTNPSSTSLLGHDAAHPGNGIAGRLAKKLKKTVYLSWNWDERGSGSLLLEKRIFEEIAKCPEKF
ncbi:hypothetical protein HUJ04_013092 [Dendroctonus ponderosae]|nr:hypothetical protein HUJ04_013092 [Dendroctonus ponderosae]KAH1006643.1 hypothetical protein HUJ05_007355 [Dendroctonus ponderosae]